MHTSRRGQDLLRRSLFSAGCQKTTFPGWRLSKQNCLAWQIKVTRTQRLVVPSPGCSVMQDNSTQPI